MTESSPLLQVGDFAKNKIHGYITMLYKEYWGAWDALIVATPEDWMTNFIKVGILRSELSTELKSVPATSLLITKAKEYLDTLNSVNILDNLTYIEILNKLNEQEKALKNEN